MNETIRQQISAFVDGELPDNESELLLRRMSQDPELRNQAAHYLTIGGAIRGDLSLPSMVALRQRIGVAIDDVSIDAAENTGALTERTGRVQGGLMRPVAGVAVAASVAVMALVGLRQVGSVDELPTATLEGFDDRRAVAIDGGSLYTEPPAVEFMSDRPSDRLTQYYLSHGQQSASLGSRLVGLEVREDRLGSTPSSATQPGPANGSAGPEEDETDDSSPEAAQSESAQ